jgi:hypothetical protein
VGSLLFWAEMLPRSENIKKRGVANPTKGFSFEKMAQSRHIWRRKNNNNNNNPFARFSS